MLERIKKWLDTQVVVRWVVVRLAPPAVAGALTALAVLGVLPPEAVAACRAALGL